MLGDHLALILNARKQGLGRADTWSSLVTIEGKLDIPLSVLDHEARGATSEVRLGK